MKRITVILTVLSLNLAIGFTANAAATSPNSSASSAAVRTQTEDLQPFTHLAQIPAGADTATIRFERVKTVQVATKITSTLDAQYCQDLAFRDPGGSMYCEHSQKGSMVTAYEVSYSYLGQPLASDEYASRRFTFQVYYRPEELSPEIRQALAAGKPNRAELARYFAVNSRRELATQHAVDESQSHFCAGNFVDGAWTRSDAQCQDQVSYKAISGSSDFMTVSVQPASALAAAPAGNTAQASSGSK